MLNGMTLHTDAIFEDGVLRPLSPLNLREHEVVSLSIVSSTEPAALESVGERQRNVLLAYVAKVESTPSPQAADGFSNRDHDRLIYGE
jgi:predicted DNA-binding antitoxin AbrB/MazE fold protein